MFRFDEDVPDVVALDKLKAAAVAGSTTARNLIYSISDMIAAGLIIEVPHMEAVDGNEIENEI